jgi:Mrp family chromosome partitioning ATPase/capsular polysaccharide biosynthesis protein
MELNDLATALRRHRGPALCVLATALGVALLAWSLPSRGYEASTAVLVEPAGDSTDFGAVEATRSVWLPTIAAQVATRSFRDAVAERMRPRPPENGFTLDGEFEGSSLILHVTARADDPDLARRAADAAAAAVRGRRISDAVRLRVIDTAATPTAPIGPGLAVHLIAGVAVGVIGAVLLALGLASIERTRGARRHPGPDGSPRPSGDALTVLAEIPASSALARRGALPARDPEPAVVAAFETLAGALANVGGGDAVAIIPAVGGDGASTVTAGLGLALAARGVPVTVVDAAVRGPVMHEYLGVRNGSGLADLASGAIVPDVLRQTGSAGLTVLPAGHTSAARAASLVAGTMPVVLDALADQLVLIDTQAPSDAPETTAVARLSRGVLLVADADHLDVAPGVASSLERAGATMLGIVITHVTRPPAPESGA